MEKVQILNEAPKHCEVRKQVSIKEKYDCLRKKSRVKLAHICDPSTQETMVERVP